MNVHGRPSNHSHWPKMKPGILFVALLIAVAPHQSRGANSIQIPILQNRMNVFTRRFARIPDNGDRSASILCLIQRGPFLWVCTDRKLYEVNSRGNVRLILDVGAAIRSATGRGLNFMNRVHGGFRSVAPHPNFAQNGLLYTSVMEDRPAGASRSRYISDAMRPIRADSVLVEWRWNKQTNRVDPSSYRELFRVGMPFFDHPIKQIAFHNGLLYIAHGDGSVTDVTVGGGMRNDALGKILRISPERSGSRPYTIPRDNPFINNSRAPDEVWALGFRNPHHICFGKDGTLYVGETGRSNVEEVNLVKRGRNYGWSLREGTFVHKGGRIGGQLLNGIAPLPPNDGGRNFEYPSAQVGHVGERGTGLSGQAIAGGCPVENGSPMSGHYFYSDFPKTGNLYFSEIGALKNAVTSGQPQRLTQARTMQARIIYNGRQFSGLGDAMRSEPMHSGKERVDVRMGRGPGGRLFWSSKTTGWVYLFTSSARGGPGGRTDS